MKSWILPCNIYKKYDVIGAFTKFNSIDWHQTKQTKNISIGDIVYIYVSNVGLCFKCNVTKRDIFTREINDTQFVKSSETPSEFFEIKCTEKYFPDNIISLDELREYGLKHTIQGPIIIEGELLKFIERKSFGTQDSCIKCHSWTIINEDTIIKNTDKSVFEYNTSGIPKETQWFFEVEHLPIDTKYDLKLIYENNAYTAYIRRESSGGRTRIFWEQPLAAKFKNYYRSCNNAYPQLVFIRVDKSTYRICFQDNSTDFQLIDTPNIRTINDSKLENMAIIRSTNIPRKETITAVITHRDSYVPEYAKRRANGVCQLCGNPAPFCDAQDMPYLETHHIKWLSVGGADSITNTVALCPNCHRKMHIVNNKSDQIILKKIAKETLYTNI